MPSDSTANCTHYDQKLRWLGICNGNGKTVYRYQCRGCGATFSAYQPMTPESEVDPLAAFRKLVKQT